MLVGCNLLNINGYCAISEFVRKLLTICSQWSIELIKIAHVLQVGWRESLHPRHFILQVLTEILVKARTIIVGVLLSFNVSSQLIFSFAIFFSFYLLAKIRNISLLCKFLGDFFCVFVRKINFVSNKIRDHLPHRAVR